LNSLEYDEEDGMTTVAAKPAGSRITTAEPGSWWLVLLGGLAGQAARVAEADRGRAALLATVSHDLRAPLAAAKAAVSGLRAGPRLTTDDRADLLTAAEESLDQLAHLAASLLDVSRLQAGARAVFPRPAHVGEIVAAALEALGPQPKPVLADIPSGLPEIMADPAIAERVIVNLAGNALRYSPAAAPPLLTARTAGNWVELRVVDHGPGIPAADQKRVFQPFCRLGAVGDSTGVGLGLAVARGLAEIMGGTVEPEDTPGGGLTMVLTLPARAAAESRGTRRIRAALRGRAVSHALGANRTVADSRAPGRFISLGLSRD
jgi:two-component system, OmpR family, sensor histidine kinase KdpD